MKAGIHTKSIPDGATYPLAIAIDLIAWFNAPAPIACNSALSYSFISQAIAPATKFGSDLLDIFKIFSFIFITPFLQ